MELAVVGIDVNNLFSKSSNDWLYSVVFKIGFFCSGHLSILDVAEKKQNDSLFALPTFCPHSPTHSRAEPRRTEKSSTKFVGYN